MLSPVPGLTFLKVLVPDTPAERDLGERLDMSAHRAAAQLVLVALEAAFRMRPLEKLSANRFSPAVRNHISARLRTTTDTGAVRLDALHVRPSGEAFGSATVAGSTHAFTARVSAGRLEFFRVL